MAALLRDRIDTGARFPLIHGVAPAVPSRFAAKIDTPARER